ncbi:MAG TPA: hypothetical protein VKB46_28095 [Pyrinomonadaceae bacterium]|nr:hypothetical protein [Pyrinomonadaceae bacterium]
MLQEFVPFVAQAVVREESLTDTTGFSRVEFQFLPTASAPTDWRAAAPRAER